MDLCLLLVRALRALNGFSVRARPCWGSPSSPAHGPGPYFSPMGLSVPTPVTPQQGWSPAVYNSALPGQGPHWVRPTHAGWKPGLALVCPCPQGRDRVGAALMSPGAPGRGMGPGWWALPCLTPWGPPTAPAAQGAAGPHGTMTLLLKLGFLYNIWRLFPIQQSISMLTKDWFKSDQSAIAASIYCLVDCPGIGVAVSLCGGNTRPHAHLTLVEEPQAGIAPI